MARIFDIDTPPENIPDKPKKNSFGWRIPSQQELRPVEGFATEPEPAERDWGTVGLDSAKSFSKGAGTLTKGIGWLTGNETLEEIGRDAEAYWSESQSADLKSKLAKVEQAEGFIGKLSAFAENPAAMGDAIVQSIPMMIPGMGVGALSTRAVGAVAHRLALRAGASAEVAAAAAQKAALRTAIATNVTGEGAVSGGATGSEVESFAKAKGATTEEAKRMANEAALKAGLWTAAGAMVGAGMESRAMLGQMTDKGVKGLAKNTAKEAGEEMLQNPGESYAAYEQKVKLDPTQKFDLGGSMAEGLVTGGPMGAGFHVAGALGSRGEAATEAPPPGDAPAQPTPVQHAPPSTPPEQPPVDTNPDLQMQNRDRGTAASVVQVKSIANAPDFDRLGASPIADVGAPLVSIKDNADGALDQGDIGNGGTITLPDGAKVDFRYAVVDANAVLTSHDATGRGNPDYGNPQPGQIVALTNGRMAGLQEAYKIGTASQPGGYMDRLMEDAATFGIQVESITGKEAPVLVRLYDDAVNARPDIGKMSNAGGSMRMSAQEVARNDARILPDVSSLVIGEHGDLESPENQPFLRGFVHALPANERSEVLDREGRLSQVGMRRIRNAIIHRAYGESSVFGRLVESLDSGMANLSKALVRAAPKVARVKDLMAAGAARDMDVTATLIKAVEEIETMRKNGLSMADFLAQARMFDQLSPELVEVLAFLDANLRSPNRIAAFIELYYQKIEALGDPRTLDMFGAPQISSANVLKMAATAATREVQDDGVNEAGAGLGGGTGSGEILTANASGTPGGETTPRLPGADQLGAGVVEQPEGAQGGGGVTARELGAGSQVRTDEPVGEQGGEAGRAEPAGGEDKGKTAVAKKPAETKSTGKKIVEELKAKKTKRVKKLPVKEDTSQPAKDDLDAMFDEILAEETAPKKVGLGDRALATVLAQSSNESDMAAAQAEIDRRQAAVPIAESLPGDAEKIGASKAPSEPAPADPVATAVQAMADAVKGLQTALAPKAEELANRVGTIGMMMESGEVVLTATGRKTTPFPKIGTGPRGTAIAVKAADKWLIENAIAEAESRGDSFNLTGFKQVNQEKPSQSDKDSAEMYLFDTEQPAVPKPFLKPLNPEAREAAEKAEGKYTGPKDVSTRDGQMELANRGGTIAALKALNAQLRAIDPNEAWADKNIEESADLDGLRDKISTALVKAQRAEPAQEAIDAALDSVLKASGSALRHYTMPKSLADMREAMRKAMYGEYEQVNGAVANALQAEVDALLGIAADSIEQLRKIDVYRVITSTPAIFRTDMAGRIKAARPDLAQEVDDVMAEAGAPAQANPDAAAAAEAAVSAAKNTAAGLSDVIDGLGKLFGGPGTLGMGPVFNEDTYAKAKPLFQQAIAHFKDAGTDIKEAMRAVVRLVMEKFGPQVTENMKPYIVRFAEDVRDGNIVSEPVENKQELEAENVYDKRSGTDLERDSEDADPEDAMGAPDVQDDREPDGGSGERGIPVAETASGERGGDGLRGRETATAGERGDQSIYTGTGRPGSAASAAGSDFDSGSDSAGLDGAPIEPEAADFFGELAESGLSLDAAKIRQLKADKAEHKPGLANIRETLPILTEGQQEDVHTAETRFAKPDGYGMLFTNGTGTGKTFSALGIIKRFDVAGKSNVIIAVPNDKISDDWQKAGRLLGLNISRLNDTKDAGRGIVITTYANFGQNPSLASREWDLIVADEAHYLAQDKDGSPTLALKALQAISMHPQGVIARHAMLYREDIAKMKDIQIRLEDNIEQGKRNATPEIEAENDLLVAALEAAMQRDRTTRKLVEEDVASHTGAARPRVLFLSATPFAYEKSVDWANGYLFDYNEGQPENRNRDYYNSGSPRERFFMQHFGYRMRYNKLTEPDSRVDRGLMQRQFNSLLKKRGALAGRMLDVKADYDRRFILTESAIGTRIDQALEWFETQRKAQNNGTGETGERIAAIMAKADPRFVALGKLRDTIAEKFDYLSRRYLLEAIKAQEVIPHVREHLALGRKVVVFHDYKKGGGFNPFRINLISGNAETKEAQEENEAYNRVVDEFTTEFADLIESDVWKASSPITAFKKAFPNVILFNGDVPKAQRRANVEKFQDDASGPQVILVQSAAGKEGISLHDTTGKHQRVLFNLGQPTQPTTAIQQEGRIYRTGQATDAIFRYLNTGTDWEKWAFATTISQRASAAENLGMGESARALKDAFIAGFEESDDYRAGMDGEGKGGKERDKAANAALTEYDRAKAFYFSTQKKNSKTKASEGVDYFATPEPVGLKMMELADIRPGESVLEPSAGHGAIARWAPETAVKTAIEPSMALRQRLAMVFDGKILGHNFEDLNIVNKYDAVVMNPPFGSGGKTAIDHVAKAAQHLRDGGRIVALIPRGPAADKKFDKWFYEESEKPAKPLYTHPELGPIYENDTVTIEAFGSTMKIAGPLSIDGSGSGPYFVRPKGENKASGTNLIALKEIQPGKRTNTYKAAEGLHLVANIDLPMVTFERAGTQVSTRIVVIEKSTDAPQKSNRDYSNVTDINDLFDRMENLSIAPRAKLVKADEPAAKPGNAKVEVDHEAAQAAADAAGLEIVEHVTQKGKTLRGVVRTDLTRDQAKKIDAFTFKKGGGWFIREKHLAPPKLDGETRFSRADQQEGQPFKPVDTESAEFKAWFGGSKVVDADGNPIVVSHFTDADNLTVFDRSRLGENTDSNTDQDQARKMARLGFWFSDTDIRYTRERGRGMFADNKVDVYLSIKNPVEFATFDDMWAASDAYGSADEWRDSLESAGHDGVIVKDDNELGGTSFIAFDPTQVKSATSNTGEFSATNPDIRYSRSNRGGVHADDLAAAVKALRAAFPGLQFHPLEQESQAPDELLNAIKAAGGDVAAAMHKGEVYLFASSLRDAQDVLNRGIHEAVHVGLARMFGTALDPLLLDIHRSNVKVQLRAARIKAKYRYSMVRSVEEVLADMGPEAKGLKGWQKLIAWVRSKLRAAGLVRDWSDADIEALVLRALAAAKKPADTHIARGSVFAEKPVTIDEKPKFSRTEQQEPEPSSIDIRNATLQRVEEILRRKASGETIIDTMIRVPMQAVGIDKVTRLGGKVVRKIIDVAPESIKAGMVSDYGIPDDAINHRDAMFGHQRRRLRGVAELMERMAVMSREESRVAYEWLNNRNADELLESLPEKSRADMIEIKQQIDDLGKEAVDLGLLSVDAYEAHKGAYVHRSYRKWDIDSTKGERTSREYTKQILGEQFKTRGLTELVPMVRVQNTNPTFWKRKIKTGTADHGLRGEQFIRFERHKKAVGTASLPGVEGAEQAGKVVEVQYWPASEPVPARYGAWHQAGTFTVRGTKGDKLIMNRDWTKSEREKMGEIEDARYAIAKTFHQMIHDIEVAKYLQWIAGHYGKEVPPRGVIPVKASESMRNVFGKDDWVQVPNSTVGDTTIKRYGKLSGLYIPGPIWNDIRQVANHNYQPFGETYANILKAWKLSKTALSPGVHTNNIMSNFVMADWHDVRAGDVLEALHIIVRQKDPANKELLGRFEDSGGTIGMYTLSEIKRDQLEPLIEQLRADVAKVGELHGMVGAGAALQSLLHGRMKEAYEIARSTKSGRMSAAVVKKMMDLYEDEDTVFRLAAFIKAKRNGATDLEAGKISRRSFLDYHINAPWIQAMRQTAFPFISFTYRAVPMLLEIIETKPWKIAKLAAFAGLLNALGYALSGGDEDKERRYLPNEKSGRVWGIVPKLIRMPWNDANDSPVFLDIRRWIPVGDVLDTGQSHAALPLIPVVIPSGPVALLAELLANKSQFTGKEITKRTDTAGEKTAAVIEHLFKAFAPNLFFLPGTYAATSVVNAGTGRTDVFGREQSVGMALASGIGIKLAAYPTDVLQRNATLELKGHLREINENMYGLGRERAVGGLSDADFSRKIQRESEKRKRLVEEFQRR